MHFCFFQLHEVTSVHPYSSTKCILSLISKFKKKKKKKKKKKCFSKDIESHALCNLWRRNLTRCIRQPTICLCETKDADQLCSNCTADQRLCFRFSDSTIPLLLKCKLSCIQPAYVPLQADCCRTWSETQIVGFSHAKAHLTLRSLRAPSLTGITIEKLLGHCSVLL